MIDFADWADAIVEAYGTGDGAGQAKLRAFAAAVLREAGNPRHDDRTQYILRQRADEIERGSR